MEPWHHAAIPFEEDQITQYDTSYFNTQEGLDGLITGAYEN